MCAGNAPESRVGPHIIARGYTYMRARAGLADTLLKLGDEDAAISHYRDMLKLNSNDNQGIRYVLAALLLRRGEETGLKELLAAYEDEGERVLALYPRPPRVPRRRRGQ